jgi:sulfur relay (sulfurtransferase) DsrF/TusC family protein
MTKTCEIKKTIVFILSESPFASDRNYHVLRMALAIALDAQPRIILTGEAVQLSRPERRIHAPLPDAIGQLRLLREMEVPVYVLEEDLQERSIPPDDLCAGVHVISRQRLAEFVGTATLVAHT